MKQPSITILTGCSGSGKSTALAAFEDAGFFCIDNMPVQLVPSFLDQAQKNTAHIAGWVFVMDMRDRGFLNGYRDLLDELKRDSYQVTIVFLDADEQILQRRYSQTRRPHPLGRDGNLLSAIRTEKKRIQPLRKLADHVIDTSHFSVHELKFAILNIAQKHTSISGMAINVVSFGFKHGTPPDADMIIDVRFLNNPYFVTDLKAKNGESKEVQQFVMKDPKTTTFLEKYTGLLDFLIPLYEQEGKAYLTIAVGCTGGMHRSVVAAIKIYEHLQLKIKRKQSTVRLIHRDIQFS